MFAGLKINNTLPKTASFDVNDVDVCVVNALRRTMIAEVPTVAFSFDPTVKHNDIEVHANTGALHNEFLAHRLSLVPLHFSGKEVEDFNPEKYVFSVKVQNTGSEMLNVTTDDIEIHDESGTKYPSSFHERIFPANPKTKDHILLTKLKPNVFDKNRGDQIHLEAKASVNIGKVHSRWSPVSLCTYYNNLDPKLVEQGLQAYVKEHAASGFSEDELRKRFNTLQIYRCYKTNRFGEPSSFHFDIQSECDLTPTYVFAKAIDTLVSKLERFIVNVDESTDAVSITQSQGMSYITVDEEDHTFGNLVQAMFYNLFIRDFKANKTDDKESENEKDKEPKISYIGYYQPHPLENKVLLKVKSNEDVTKVLKLGCQLIVNYLNHLQDEWSAFTTEK